MKYLKTYNAETKDYVYHVTVDEHSSFSIEHPFNSISRTYGATFFNIEVGDLRGLLRKIPDFVEEFSWHEIDKSLQQFGFEKQTEPTKTQKLLYINEKIVVQ
jgi:hypothetical protein